MFSLSRIIRTCSSKGTSSSLPLYRSLLLTNFTIPGRLVHSFITSTTPANKTQSLVLPQIAAAQNNWIYRENDKIHLPLISNITNIELPNGKIWVPPISEPTTGQDIVEAPSSNSSDTVIEAARLITIRKKKMKKHKLRKLRKRLKFERAKVNFFVIIVIIIVLC